MVLITKYPKVGWYSWFAWHPVRTNDGFTVWLEYVYRQDFSPSDEDHWYCPVYSLGVPNEESKQEA